MAAANSAKVITYFMTRILLPTAALRRALSFDIARCVEDLGVPPRHGRATMRT
jgi:hypothetical protein